ncbi:MAG: methyltransferase domain-containing protein [Deltaproteobacteria bacterium]|jgi:SAM-dependent methyltransferase|nr:methyltransferase domain-containing protein [Deltaproteobacteria bacterium]
MSDSRTRWDARWRDKRTQQGIVQADPWLIDIYPRLDQGQALDVACGNGSNAVFLASHGFEVTAIDVSREALKQLKRESALRNLNIKAFQIDLEDDPVLPEGPFNLILDFFYLYRPLFPKLKKLLLPGGLMAIRTFSRAGDFPEIALNPAFVLEPGELKDIFCGWDVLVYEEGKQPSPKGGSLAGILTRKPLDPSG